MHFNNTLDLNNYTVVSTIGGDGFGKFTKVQDKSTGELFSAKVYYTSLYFNEKDVVVRSVEILSKSKHPSIIKFVGFSPTDFKNSERPVIMTELMSNGSLRDILELCDKGQLNLINHDGVQWNDTRKLINIYGIAHGMKYLHSHGVIHRDLKPPNILLDDSLCPKITGFEIALYKNQNENCNNIAGTPIYIAPEVWTDQLYSEACDVYAFAIIVYEIMNDKPFKNCTGFGEIMNEVANNIRPQIHPSVPAAYKGLIERCWKQNPSERPTFDQIVEELKTNEGFITELVDENDYFDYIDYLDQCEQAFESDKHIIEIDKYIKRESQTFKRISCYEKTIKEFNLLDLTSKMSITSKVRTISNNKFIKNIHSLIGHFYDEKIENQTCLEILSDNDSKLLTDVNINDSIQINWFMTEFIFNLIRISFYDIVKFKQLNQVFIEIKYPSNGFQRNFINLLN